MGDVDRLNIDRKFRVEYTSRKSNQTVRGDEIYQGKYVYISWDIDKIHRERYYHYSIVPLTITNKKRVHKHSRYYFP